MRATESLHSGVAFAFVLSLFSVIGALARLVPASWTRKQSATARAVQASSAARAKPRRRTARATLTHYAIMSLLLWALYSGHAWTRRSVGISRHDSLAVSAIAGLLIFWALLGLYGVAVQLLNLRESERRANLRIGFGMLPTNARARCIVIAVVCLVNPIVEELIFRGLLVHQSAALYGNLPRALLLGALVNATNHAYQGFRSVPFHLLVYSATVGLMYSRYGLIASIAFHYAGDAVPLLSLQDRLRDYRGARRIARRTRKISA